MRCALFTFIATVIGCVGSMGAGCGSTVVPVGSSETTVVVFNGGLDDVRVGIDRSGGGTISQITPVVPPNGSARVTFTLGGSRTFDAYARGPETGNEFAGPFSCSVDVFCGDPNETQIIWTGEELLCTSTDAVIVELANDSSETAFLLVEDEQPQLPIVPLLPGERRFVSRSTGAGQIGVLVRAFADDPIRGLHLTDYTTCRAGVGCRPLRVRYADGGLQCGG